ncbi:MAG: flagellar biosynthesis protein FlhB [Planctomycetota bacterium]|jgi:flagellar biosynthetic protein FlhB|nr:flagellar biosynthesis protein FlhB [Planctomycetota bacterium]
MAAGREEKTEEATAKKKADARRRGNIPKSRDFTAALEMLGAVYLLRYLGPTMARYMRTFIEKMLGENLAKLPPPDGKELIAYAVDWGWWILIILLPFLLLACLSAIVANVFQTGFYLSFQTVKIRIGKLNPVAGLKRIFTLRNLVTLIMNLCKLAVVMPVAWWVMNAEFRNVFTLLEMAAEGTLEHLVDRVLGLARTLSIILLALGIADFRYRKYQYLRDLRMTKQEVKEEFRQMEGDPKIKQKIRQKQLEAARMRMLQDVPQAEVVVRNPTHFAVAISYTDGMIAPKVTAKGKDKVAERIIEIAREAGVPMVENKKLAQDLYRTVEVGDAIPEELFAAVAEVLEVIWPEEKKRQIREAAA